MNTTVNLFLVDSHPVILEGLATLLQGEKGCRIMGSAPDAWTALEYINAQPECIDLVITEVQLPDKNGLVLCREIKQHYPPIRVLFLSMLDNLLIIQNALDAGADGYLLKSTGTKAILEAPKKIQMGHKVYDPQILPLIKHRLTEEKWHGKKEWHHLTEREFEILRLIVKECNSDEIAQRLHLSKKTVDNHRANILLKLGCRSTIGLVKYALTIGIEPF